MQSEVGGYLLILLFRRRRRRQVEGQIGISADFHLAGKKAFDRNLVSSSGGLVPYINLLNVLLFITRKEKMALFLAFLVAS